MSPPGHHSANQAPPRAQPANQGDGPVEAPPPHPVAWATPPLTPENKNKRKDLKLTDRADLEAWRQALFSDVGDRPPGPRHQITLAEVQECSQRWQANREAGRCHTTEADVDLDVDGVPTGVGPSTDVFMFSSRAISQADADRLGIEAGQYPGVTIVRPYSERDNNR